MSVPLRSAGWSVQPSFVPHGPTTGVTLLADERGLTQLAGIPDVAWQTPWDELTQVQLVRAGRGMALYASAGGVRYCWRHTTLEDYEDWREVVVAHGGEALRRPRRVGVVVVVGVVLLASFAGGIAAFFTGGSAPSGEVTAAEAVNLTRADLPAWYQVSTTSVLAQMIAPAGQVVASTTSTTAPAANSTWARLGRAFASCVGVSAATDRVFGAAGQQPDYQVASPVFAADSFGGIQLASTTQYYSSAAMVSSDVAEMSRAAFGGCFAAANANILLSTLERAVVTSSTGVAWTPATYLRGWVAGGVSTITLPVLGGPYHLVIGVAASGHYEVTLSALVVDWPASQAFLTTTLNTLVSRIASSTATAA